jgi:DNA-directed RNA polymerase subunit RPC12/RpoP
MSASYQNCDKCGQTFRWARMPHGQFVPMEADGSGKHVCIPRTRSSSAGQYGANHGIHQVGSVPARSWRLESLGQPLTSSTRCWWCGERVFFHTNGNGDCVLFEALGWPWPIHSCWQIHRDESQRRIGLSKLETALEQSGYDGIKFSPPDCPPIPEKDAPDQLEWRRKATNCLVQMELEDDPSRRFVRVAGYLSRKTNLSLALSLDESCEPWRQIGITTAEDRQLFFLPRNVFNSLSEFALIRIAGRWCNIQGNYFLISTRIDWLETVGCESQSLRLAKIGRKARCRYCGRQLFSDERWQINGGWVPECGDCFTFRGERDPKEFGRFCCRLLRHRGNRRNRRNGDSGASEAGTGQNQPPLNGSAQAGE